MLELTPHDELDAGPRKSGPGTERFCVATRTVRPVDRLIRFVVGPQGVVPDLKRKLPGRGLWITADKAVLQDAVARNVFARGFRRDVGATPELVDLTERLLVSAVLDALAIAGKSGLAVTGFSRVQAALAHETLAALLHASDAGADGMAKLRGALRQRPDAQRIGVVAIFTSAQLDLALGRSNVVHAALLAGPASDTFLARFVRLERFRTGETGEAGHGRARH
jgi:predicted RNA-binding protein YlxR (DUF448 family)